MLPTNPKPERKSLIGNTYFKFERPKDSKWKTDPRAKGQILVDSNGNEIKLPSNNQVIGNSIVAQAYASPIEDQLVNMDKPKNFNPVALCNHLQSQIKDSRDEGSTATVASLSEDGKLEIATLGDSPVYLVVKDRDNNDIVIQITEDMDAHSERYSQCVLNLNNMIAMKGGRLNGEHESFGMIGILRIKSAIRKPEKYNFGEGVHHDALNRFLREILSLPKSTNINTLLKEGKAKVIVASDGLAPNKITKNDREIYQSVAHYKIKLADEISATDYANSTDFLPQPTEANKIGFPRVESGSNVDIKNYYTFNVSPDKTEFRTLNRPDQIKASQEGGLDILKVNSKQKQVNLLKGNENPIVLMANNKLNEANELIKKLKPTDDVALGVLETNNVKAVLDGHGKPPLNQSPLSHAIANEAKSYIQKQFNTDIAQQQPVASSNASAYQKNSPIKNNSQKKKVFVFGENHTEGECVYSALNKLTDEELKKFVESNNIKYAFFEFALADGVEVEYMKSDEDKSAQGLALKGKVIKSKASNKTRYKKFNPNDQVKKNPQAKLLKFTDATEYKDVKNIGNLVAKANLANSASLAKYIIRNTLILHSDGDVDLDELYKVGNVATKRTINAQIELSGRLAKLGVKVKGMETEKSMSSVQANGADFNREETLNIDGADEIKKMQAEGNGICIIGNEHLRSFGRDERTVSSIQENLNSKGFETEVIALSNDGFDSKDHQTHDKQNGKTNCKAPNVYITRSEESFLTTIREISNPVAKLLREATNGIKPENRGAGASSASKPEPSVPTKKIVFYLNFHTAALGEKGELDAQALKKLKSKRKKDREHIIENTNKAIIPITTTEVATINSIRGSKERKEAYLKFFTEKMKTDQKFAQDVKKHYKNQDEWYVVMQDGLPLNELIQNPSFEPLQAYYEQILLDISQVLNSEPFAKECKLKKEEYEAIDVIDVDIESINKKNSSEIQQLMYEKLKEKINLLKNPKNIEIEFWVNGHGSLNSDSVSNGLGGSSREVIKPATLVQPIINTLNNIEKKKGDFKINQVRGDIILSSCRSGAETKKDTSPNHEHFAESVHGKPAPENALAGGVLKTGDEILQQTPCPSLKTVVAYEGSILVNVLRSDQVLASNKNKPRFPFAHPKIQEASKEGGFRLPEDSGYAFRMPKGKNKSPQTPEPTKQEASKEDEFEARLKESGFRLPENPDYAFRIPPANVFHKQSEQPHAKYHTLLKGGKGNKSPQTPEPPKRTPRKNDVFTFGRESDIEIHIISGFIDNGKIHTTGDMELRKLHTDKGLIGYQGTGHLYEDQILSAKRPENFKPADLCTELVNDFKATQTGSTLTVTSLDKNGKLEIATLGDSPVYLVVKDKNKKDVVVKVTYDMEAGSERYKHLSEKLGGIIITNLADSRLWKNIGYIKAETRPAEGDKLIIPKNNLEPAILIRGDYANNKRIQNILNAIAKKVDGSIANLDLAMKGNDGKVYQKTSAGLRPIVEYDYDYGLLNRLNGGLAPLGAIGDCLHAGYEQTLDEESNHQNHHDIGKHAGLIQKPELYNFGEGVHHDALNNFLQDELGINADINELLKKGDAKVVAFSDGLESNKIVSDGKWASVADYEIKLEGDISKEEYEKSTTCLPKPKAITFEKIDDERFNILKEEKNPIVLMARKEVKDPAVKATLKTQFDSLQTHDDLAGGVVECDRIMVVADGHETPIAQKQKLTGTQGEAIELDIMPTSHSALLRSKEYIVMQHFNETTPLLPVKPTKGIVPTQEMQDLIYEKQKKDNKITGFLSETIFFTESSDITQFPPLPENAKENRPAVCIGDNIGIQGWGEKSEEAHLFEDQILNIKIPKGLSPTTLCNNLVEDFKDYLGGTTVTIANLDNNGKLEIATLGDSPVYLVVKDKNNKDVVIQITEDMDFESERYRELVKKRGGQLGGRSGRFPTSLAVYGTLGDNELGNEAVIRKPEEYNFGVGVHHDALNNFLQDTLGINTDINELLKKGDAKVVVASDGLAAGKIARSVAHYKIKLEDGISKEEYETSATCLPKPKAITFKNQAEERFAILEGEENPIILMKNKQFENALNVAKNLKSKDDVIAGLVTPGKGVIVFDGHQNSSPRRDGVQQTTGIVVSHEAAEQAEHYIRNAKQQVEFREEVSVQEISVRKDNNQPAQPARPQIEEEQKISEAERKKNAERIEATMRILLEARKKSDFPLEHLPKLIRFGKAMANNKIVDEAATKENFKRIFKDELQDTADLYERAMNFSNRYQKSANKLKDTITDLPLKFSQMNQKEMEGEIEKVLLQAQKESLEFAQQESGFPLYLMERLVTFAQENDGISSSQSQEKFKKVFEPNLLKKAITCSRRYQDQMGERTGTLFRLAEINTESASEAINALKANSKGTPPLNISSTTNRKSPTLEMASMILPTKDKSPSRITEATIKAKPKAKETMEGRVKEFVDRVKNSRVKVVSFAFHETLIGFNFSDIMDNPQGAHPTQEQIKNNIDKYAVLKKDLQDATSEEARQSIRAKIAETGENIKKLFGADKEKYNEQIEFLREVFKQLKEEGIQIAITSDNTVDVVFGLRMMGIKTDEMHQVQDDRKVEDKKINIFGKGALLRYEANKAGPLETKFFKKYYGNLNILHIGNSGTKNALNSTVENGEGKILMEKLPSSENNLPAFTSKTINDVCKGIPSPAK